MPRALLLANGFSRAYDNALFAYDALYQAAGLSPRLEQVFGLIGTTDFEAVMRALGQTHALLPPYLVPSQYIYEIQEDINVVRRSLIEALTQHHPAGRFALNEPRAQICGEFLSNFDRVYTTNYDLLLYWVFLDNLMHLHRDGFGGAPHAPLVWRGPKVSGQTVFYLHGALHLYDDGANVYKIRSTAEATILDQLEHELDNGNYPLFVSEGTSRQKMARIRSNPYLFDAYEALSQNDLPLFVYGFKFGEMDEHIMAAIEKSRTPKLDVALFSRALDEEKNVIKERVTRLGARTAVGNNITFIESNTIPVWDNV